MPQHVKADTFQLCALGGFFHWATLLARGPTRTISALKHQFVPGSTSAHLAEELRPLGRQHDVSRLPALAFADRHGAGIDIEVLYFQPDQLAKPAAAFQRRTYQRAELRIGRIDQPTSFLGR